MTEKQSFIRNGMQAFFNFPALARFDFLEAIFFRSGAGLARRTFKFGTFKLKTSKEAQHG